MSLRRAFLVVVFVCCCPVLVFAQTSIGKYRVGVILPLSGPLASLGNYVQKGVELAYEHLPAVERERLQLLFEDDGFEPSRTISAYRKFMASGGVDAVFVMASPPANALGPITERERKILLAVGASDPSIALGKSYSFIHWVIPPVLGEALADELQRRQYQRIALVATEATGALADIEAAEQSVRKRGLGDRLVYRQTFAQEDVDFRSTISQLRQKKADAVVMAVLPGGLSAFAKQYRASGASGELIGMETFEDESEVKSAGGALTGAWYVNASAATESFVSAYRARYGSHPGWATCNAYDALKLVAQAVTTVGTEADAVRDYLRSVKNYAGACGRYSASGDNRFTLPAELKVVTPNGFEALKH